MTQPHMDTWSPKGTWWSVWGRPVCYWAEKRARLAGSDQGGLQTYKGGGFPVKGLEQGNARVKFIPTTGSPTFKNPAWESRFCSWSV